MTEPGARVKLRHAKVAQLADGFRARYATSEGRETLRLAAWIMDALDAGDVKDAEIRSAFGLANPAYQTLKAKWSTYRDLFKGGKDVRGE